MSERYVGVQWNARKIVYDVFVIVGVLLFTTLFGVVTRGLFDDARAINSQIVSMRAWGTCAFIMLSLILMIGPLARLDRRFLPILYNRRHFGVIFFFVALQHAHQVINFYHEWTFISKWESLLVYDTAFTATSMPFQLFGVAALIIFLVMAVTSHDFWQKVLGPTMWKSLHMLVYVAYVLVVAHVVFGALQLENHPAWLGVFGASVVAVVGLHAVAALKSTQPDRNLQSSVTCDGADCLDAGSIDDLALNHPISVVGEDGERIAVVRHEGGVSALHGVCAHQGGPLGEGRVIDGCLTCPWHGWQYRPEDGRAPEPFTEKIPTHRVKLDDSGRVLVEKKALLPGTPVEPAQPKKEQS